LARLRDSCLRRHQPRPAAGLLARRPRGPTRLATIPADEARQELGAAHG
jgi:hypothetical protein